MLERKKQFNSSLHNVSKKRLAEIQSGTYKPKKTYKIARISKKAKKRIQDYRKAAFERWGYRCFLCHRIDETGKTLNGDDPENMVPLCNRYSGCRAHNHNGHDARFYELQTLIQNKKGEKQ